MKPKLGKTDLLAILVIMAMVLGVLSSIYNLGVLSVFFSVTMPLIFIVNAIVALYGLFKKKFFYAFGMVLFLISFHFFFQFNNTSNVSVKNTISLLSYNVRAFKTPNPDGNLQSTLQGILKFIDSTNADILVIQESSYKEGRQINGYPYIFLGYRPNMDKSLLTIYSKYPIISKGYVDFEDSKNNAIFADIKIQSDTIRVYNTHLQSYIRQTEAPVNGPNGQNYWNSLNSTIAKQIVQAKQIKNHSDTYNSKTIICGDFNATPYSPTYRTIKKGMSDSYLSHGFGFGKTYSHFNYPLRLDYFLSDDHIKVESHDNYSLNLSDHEPILITFKIK